MLIYYHSLVMESFFHLILFTVAGEVSRPPEIPQSDIGPTSARVSWSPPSDPNGVITRYTVNVVACGTRPLPTRKRQLQEANLLENCVMGGAGNIDRNLLFSGDTTSAELQDLSMSCVLHAPIYELRISNTDVNIFFQLHSLTTSFLCKQRPMLVRDLSHHQELSLHLNPVSLK